MDNKAKDQARIIKSGQAGELINNPILQEIFEKIETETLRALKSANDKDLELIRIYKQVLVINDACQAWLKKTLEDGELTELKIKRSNFRSARV